MLKSTLAVTHIADVDQLSQEPSVDMDDQTLEYPTISKDVSRRVPPSGYAGMCEREHAETAFTFLFADTVT